MAFDDDYNNYGSEHDANSSASEDSFREGDSELDNEQIHSNGQFDIEYLTPDEMMAKLRENMSGYINRMQEQMSDDMRVIAELNARAASSDDPAMAAMYMTAAAELGESMNARLEIEVNTRLVEAITESVHLRVNQLLFPEKAVYHALIY